MSSRRQLTFSSSGSSRSNVPSEQTEESKTLQGLRKDNAALAKELLEIKSLHEQLLHENLQENFSEKRVNILKSQVFQLERQVNLLSEVVSGYAGMHLELQTMLETLIESLNSGNSLDDDIKLVKQIQSRLSKSNRGSAETYSLPLMFMRDFISTSSNKCSQREEPNVVTVLDVCSGKTDHINLKQVGQLESKLAKLYGELIKAQTSIEIIPTSSVPSLLQPMRHHSQSNITSCLEMISDCCHDLLCLSLLIPAVPWPSSRGKGKTPPPELSSSVIMKRMPPVIKSKKEVREAIEGVCTHFLHFHEMNRTKSEVLEEELQYHKSVYKLQVSYVESLFDAMGKGYEEFESSVEDLICKPLEEVLAGYSLLSSTVSDTALRNFLEVFKKNAMQLESAVKTMSSNREQRGNKSLSSFGENFFRSLLELEKECSMKRGSSVREK